MGGKPAWDSSPRGWPAGGGQTGQHGDGVLILVLHGADRGRHGGRGGAGHRGDGTSTSRSLEEWGWGCTGQTRGQPATRSFVALVASGAYQPPDTRRGRSDYAGLVIAEGPEVWAIPQGELTGGPQPTNRGNVAQLGSIGLPRLNAGHQVGDTGACALQRKRRVIAGHEASSAGHVPAGIRAPLPHCRPSLPGY